MLYDVSYRNKEIDEEIRSIVGNRFNLLDRLKLKGIGSQRFRCIDGSPEIKRILDTQKGGEFCNIELRKKGFVIWFRVKLHNYVLVGKYSKLIVYKSSNLLTLHFDGWKVSLSPAHNRTLKLSFIKKLLQMKNESL